LFIAGAFCLFILIATAVVMVALDLSVVWVDLQSVPAARLFLLALIGLLFSILYTLLGFFLYLQERTAKAIVYLILFWSVLNNLILTAAMLFMVF
jgi:hypothetical protein